MKNSSKKKERESELFNDDTWLTLFLLWMTVLTLFLFAWGGILLPNIDQLMDYE